MIYRFLFFFILVFQIQLCSAQQSELDTLWNEYFVKYNAEEYEEALPIIEQIVSLTKAEFGDQDTLYADAISYFGLLNSKLGQFETAIILSKKALELYIKLTGKWHQNVATCLNNLALAYDQTGNFENAIPLLEQAIDIYKNIYGFKHSDVAMSLNNLSMLYSKIGQYEKAILLNEQAVAIYLDVRGKKHSDYATSLNNLAVLYYFTAQYESALPILEQVLDIQEFNLGLYHTDVALSLNNIGLIYSQLGEYNKAIQIQNRALQIYRKVFGSEHVSVARTLNNLSVIYLKIGQHETALKLQEQVLIQYKNAYGPEHPDVTLSLSNIGSIHSEMGEYKNAMKYFDQALIINTKILGSEHPTVALNLNNLAALYSEIGSYDKALPLNVESIRIYRLVLGSEHPDVAMSLNNLASLYLSIGFFEKALPLQEQALWIWKKNLGEEHRDYAMGLNNLAVLYSEIGQNVKAIELNEFALNIRKKIFGIEHPDVAMSLNNLSLNYLDLGDFEKSIECSKKALEIYKVSFGMQHPDYALGLSNLASIYSGLGQFELALQLNEEALAIRKLLFGDTHIEVGLSLNNIASIYQDLKQNEKALSNYKMALSINEKAFGRNSPEVSLNLGNLSSVYSTMDQNEKVLSPLLEAVSILVKQIKSNFLILSEVPKMEYIEKELYQFEWLQSFSYNHPDLLLKSKKPVFNAQLFLNGIVLRTSLALSQAVYSSGDSLLEQDYNHFISLKKHYAQSITKTIEDLKNAEINLSVIEDSIEVVERRLSLRSKEFANDLVKEEIGFDDLTASLSKDAAYVYFSSFSYHNGKSWTDSIMYTAYVIQAEDKEPEQIRLFEQRALDSLLSKQKSGVGVNEVYGSSALYDLIWKPLLPSLIGSKKIYFSCSGALHSIAFSALQDNSGSILSDKYSLHQISGPAQLVIPSNPVLFTEKSPSNKDIALFGGIDYQADSADMKLAVTSFITDSTFMFATRSMLPQETDRGSVWQPLPGTMQEVESIEKLFVSNTRSSVKYKGAAALEEQVKSQQAKQAPKILHIATHGFFIPAPKEDLNKLDRQLRMSGDNAFQRAENPLLRSGLLFAGSAHTWKGEPTLLGAEDGILTAMEVSQLNLRNTRLSVLSACETGLGDVKGSEGVFGLQRAFKLAGVDYILMSLWSIPDKETNEYMQYFYGELLSTNNINTAYQTAQNKMRSRYPDEPQKWAGMVLVE